MSVSNLSHEAKHGADAPDDFPWPAMNFCKECLHIERGTWTAIDKFHRPAFKYFKPDADPFPAPPKVNRRQDTLIFKKLDQSGAILPDSIRDLLLTEINNNDQDDNVKPLLHHNLLALSKSASDGCRLCRIVKKSFDVEMMNMFGMSFTLTDEQKERIQPMVSILMRDSHPRNKVICVQFNYLIDSSWLLLTAPIDMFKITRRVAERSVGAFEEYSERYIERYLPDFRQKLRPNVLDRTKKWFLDCKGSHKRCQEWALMMQRMESHARPPTRLIKLSQRNGRLHLHLIEQTCAHITGTRHKYATLSHCWGKVLSCRLLKGNIDQFLNSIPFSYLPKTFKEAAEFTILIGLEYLWIDALCIIQDSRDDWQRESQTMHAIYSSAFVNLAATASADGDGGLFSQDESDLTDPCVLGLQTTGLTGIDNEYPPVGRGVYTRFFEEGWLLTTSHQRTLYVERAPLANRAWTHQERLLAPRTIHFAADQIWWECRTEQTCEMLSAPNEDSFDKDPFDDALVAVDDQRWDWIVARYTSANLTFLSDKLIAISGIAKAFQAVHNLHTHDYLAGMWRSQLPVALCWAAPSLSFRIDGSQTPSWSWAAIEGKVEHQIRYGSPEELVAEILSATTDLAQDSQPFGLVLGGALRIRAYLHKIRLTNKTPLGADGLYCFTKLHHQNISLSRFFVASPDLSYDEDDYYRTQFYEHLDDKPKFDDVTELQALFLPVGIRRVTVETSTKDKNSARFVRISGILLKQCLSEAGTYQRIGYLEIRQTKNLPASLTADTLLPDEYLSYKGGKYEIVIV